MRTNNVNNLNNDFTVSDIRDALRPMADTVVEQDETLTYLDSDKNEVARVKLQDDPGSYASVLMDRSGEYTAALEKAVSEVDGVGVRNGQVQVYESPKVV